MLPIELLLTGGGFALLYSPSRRLLMAAFLAFPLFVLVRTLLRHLVSRLAAPTDVLIRREYERLSRTKTS
jgi:predicted PurR-regulated permease PerM